MVREIRTPAMGNRLNTIFKMFPVQVGNQMEELVSGICLKVSVVHSGTKTANAYKRRVHEFEYWADGYVTGTGRECAIVGATFTADMTEARGTPHHERRQIVMIVHDVELFIKELRNLATVASVQTS